jgi:putative ABC transport system permease protein
MRRSLRSWLWRVPLDQEVDEEIAFHLEMRTRELVDGGMAGRRRPACRPRPHRRPRPACAAPASTSDRKRDRAMLPSSQWIDELRYDVVFALRQMRAAPAFTFVAALTLALGIGANAAIFALVDAALLRPLPFRDPDRVVMLWERTAAGER